MMKVLQSGWFAVMLGALSYLGATAAFLKPASTHPEAHGEGREEAVANYTGPAWDFLNPEFDRLVADLKKEKEALQERSRQLSDLAARLDAERAELNVVTQAVHRMRQEFEKNTVKARAEFEKDITRVHEEEVANLKRLAKTYGNMSPEGAATILKQMEDAQVIKVMVFMKDVENGPILEAIAKGGETEVKRAAMLTDKLRTAVFRNVVPKTAP
jgi:flagellar motility protein MotE (MotC chaperone)